MESTICRLCLRANDVQTTLIGNATLIERIQEISSMQIVEREDFPSLICDECIKNINHCYNFRKVIINSQLELQERFEAAKRDKEKKLRAKNEKKYPAEPIEKDEDVHFDFDVSDNVSVDFNDNNEIDNDSEEEDAKIKVEKMDESAPRSKWFKKYFCQECNLEFTSRFKLSNHKRTMHVMPGICNVCGLVVRADNLRRHVQLHSEGPATCAECGKVFKNSESLRGHMFIHRGHIYHCEKCGKTSRVRSEHRRHLKTHMDPESGKTMCTLCGKRVRDLKKHMHSHTGERPHLCLFCGKGYTSPYALKVHTRQHTNERPYKCPYCTNAFAQKVSLVTHLKSKHNQAFVKEESANAVV